MRCEHSACTQHYIETGSKRCIAPKVKEPFAAIREKGNYDGYVVDAQGRPLLATNGHALVSTAESLGSLVYALIDATSVGKTPEILKLRNIVKGLQDEPASYWYVDVHLAEPCPKRIARCTERYQTQITAWTRTVRDAEERLKRALDALKASTAKGRAARKPLIFERDEAKKSLAEERERLRTATRKLRDRDDVEFHAIGIGKAFYDRRLIQKALRALGSVKTSRAHVGEGDRCPAYIETDKGLVIVMPFLAEKLP